MSLLSTPERITADIRDMCRKIRSVDDPIFVEVAARHDSGLDDCFMDVQRQVMEHGGSVQHGWTIWEWPGIMIDAEFHAVWRKPDGVLLDVTRKQDQESRILFAPDQTRVFAGRRVDNTRLAVGRNPRIKEWIQLHEQYQRIVNRLTQGVPFGTPIVLTSEANDLQARASRLEVELMQSREARRATERSSPTTIHRSTRALEPGFISGN